MSIRPTQASTYSQVKRGLVQNFAKLAQAQLQVSSGKRILKPSDDPAGSSLVQSFKRTLASAQRYSGAIESGRTMLDSAAGNLQDASGILSEARALLVQGMNGTLEPQDRQLLANEIELIRDRMIEIANSQIGDRYLFSGTATDRAPFVEETVGGKQTVVYRGNGDAQELLVGEGVSVRTTLAGEDVFSRQQRSGIRFAGLTGMANGTSANQGVGYVQLDVQHTSTTATLGAGLALVNGGAADTILGDHTLTLDAAAGTVQLDGGPAFKVPQPGDADFADFTVTGDNGSELHLDFSGFTGANYTGTVRGDGTVSIDGSTAIPMTLTETDLELRDPATGTVLNVNTTGLRRAGEELVTFDGAVDVFDTLQGIIDGLNNTSGLPVEDLQDRFGVWLGELDRNHDNVLAAAGTLGSRSRRLTDMEESISDLTLQVEGLLSNVEDADFSQVVLEMTRAEQTLELAQATSVRLMNTSLLNFLR